MPEPFPWRLILGIALGWAASFVFGLIIGPLSPAIGVGYTLVGATVGLALAIPFDSAAARRARLEHLRDVRRRARERGVL